MAKPLRLIPKLSSLARMSFAVVPSRWSGKLKSTAERPGTVAARSIRSSEVMRLRPGQTLAASALKPLSLVA